LPHNAAPHPSCGVAPVEVLTEPVVARVPPSGPVRAEEGHDDEGKGPAKGLRPGVVVGPLGGSAWPCRPLEGAPGQPGRGELAWMHTGREENNRAAGRQSVGSYPSGSEDGLGGACLAVPGPVARPIQVGTTADGMDGVVVGTGRGARGAVGRGAPHDEGVDPETVDGTAQEAPDDTGGRRGRAARLGHPAAAIGWGHLARGRGR